MVLSERIRFLVQQKGVSIRKMLLEAGLNTNFMIDVEKKGASPSADKLVRLADYFNVSVDYLLGRTDNPEVNK